jgi:Xaa-Pro aminopeptidase
MGDISVLTQAGCRTRQERLRALLERHGLDATILYDKNEIFYFTGFLIPDFLAQPAAFYFEAGGVSLLVCATDEGEALVDERLTYEPHLLYTRNQNIVRQIAALLGQRLAGRSVRRIGWRVEALPRAIGNVIDRVIAPDEWVEIDDDVADMERAKDPDEIELIRTSIACNLAAYGAAEQEIGPRVSELAVLQAGQRSAILRAGEQVYHSGDYRAGEFGGFARPVPIHEGDLYIIDAWTEYRSYWSDMARTFAVTTATPLQREVYDHIANILRDVGGQLKPGMHGTDVWKWVDGRIREHPMFRETGLIHHAGHGVGLRAHEGPDLNRDRGEELRPGDVVSVEPGAYAPELRPGFRLENMFLITETGCELLSEYPLSLERQV